MSTFLISGVISVTMGPAKVPSVAVARSHAAVRGVLGCGRQLTSGLSGSHNIVDAGIQRAPVPCKSLV